MKKTEMLCWAIAATALAFTSLVCFAEDMPRIDYKELAALGEPKTNKPAMPRGELLSDGQGAIVAPKEDAPAAESKSWWTDFSLRTYGATKHPDFAKPVWGFGLDVGYQINRAVSLHLANSVFDQPETKVFFGETEIRTEGGFWAGPAIDETELIAQADLISTGGQGKDRFVASILGSGGREWNLEAWSFGAGVGGTVRFSKNFGAGLDSRIRAYMNGEKKDLITRLFLEARF